MGSNFFYLLKSKVYDAYDDICNFKNFNVYEFPPPDMVKGCQDFVSRFEEEILDGLVKRKDNDSAETEICFTATKVPIPLTRPVWANLRRRRTRRATFKKII